MKRHLLYALLLGGLSAPFLSAQEGPPPGEGGGQPPMPIIEALDLDHDGTISAEEIAKASESLKTLDKDGDGKITEEEFRPPHPGGPGFPGGDGAEDGPPRGQQPRGAQPGTRPRMADRPPLEDAPPPGPRDEPAPAPGRPRAGTPDQFPPRDGAPGGPDGMRQAPPILLALDGNKDGVIDATEITHAAEALKTLDKNGDGQLTRDELRPQTPGGPDDPRGEGPGARGGPPRPGREAGGPADGERPRRPRGPDNRPGRPQ